MSRDSGIFASFEVSGAVFIGSHDVTFDDSCQLLDGTGFDTTGRYHKWIEGLHDGTVRFTAYYDDSETNLFADSASGTPFIVPGQTMTVKIYPNPTKFYELPIIIESSSLNANKEQLVTITVNGRVTATPTYPQSS